MRALEREGKLQLQLESFFLFASPKFGAVPTCRLYEFFFLATINKQTLPDGNTWWIFNPSMLETPAGYHIFQLTFLEITTEASPTPAPRIQYPEDMTL